MRIKYGLNIRTIFPSSLLTTKKLRAGGLCLSRFGARDVGNLLSSIDLKIVGGSKDDPSLCISGIIEEYVIGPYYNPYHPL